MKKSKILIAGLVSSLVFGLNTINADALGKTYVDTFPETVTRTQIINYYGPADDSGFVNVNYMTDDNSEYLLYCSDRTSGFGTGSTSDTLTKDKKLDYKIAYLLKNGYPNNKFLEAYRAGAGLADPTITATDLANIFVTQVGLWSLQGTVLESHNILTSKEGLYLNSTSGNPSFKLCIKDPTSVDKTNCDEGTAISAKYLSSYVNKLVSAANAAKDPESTTLAINFDNKWELTGDIYKSSVFELTSSTDVSLSSINFDLSNAPSGTKLYAENGTDLTSNTSGITGVTKFYLTIPKSAVTSGNSNFKITASSNITYDVAYQYVDKEMGHQPSVLVGPESKEISNVMSITIVPDTASIVSKSIYFVGFILLVFGAGIIFINVKQQNRNEEV